MLLVDGDPYTLGEADRKKFSNKLKVMVPLSKVRRNPEMKNRLEPSKGQGITTLYTTFINGKMSTVRWYETKRYDDAIKSDTFTPDHIMIPDSGFLDVENDPEKVWFLLNHPGWDKNPLRKGEGGRQAVITVGTMVQFRILNLQDGNDDVFEKMKRLKKLMEDSEKWNFQDMIGICHVLVASHSASFSLPYQIVYHRELRPDQEGALKAALQEVIMREPVYVYDKIFLDRKAEISTAINALSFGENPRLVFKGQERVWELTENKKEPTKLYTVPGKEDPHTFLVKKASEDKAIGDKLIRFSKGAEVTA